jgi:hypothetical protein
MGISLFDDRLNFDPRGKLWPPGAKLSPRGEFLSPRGESIPWGWNSLFSSILLNSRECSPLGVNEGVNIPHRGQISPLGDKFTRGGQSWSQEWPSVFLNGIFEPTEKFALSLLVYFGQFFHRKKLCIYLAKNEFGSNLGDFLTISFGHPGCTTQLCM